MATKLYNDFLKNISQKFQNNFSEISAIYNFDYGDEFEIALCKSFRTVLPNYYGVCRGSIFSIDGESVGDDIIIYDQFHFPTLRLLEDNTFAQKQQIPYEAVFAYIEAKNTLVIDGSGANTIEKAWTQCQNVKKLNRKEVKYSKYSVNNIPFLKPLPYWPTIGNPIYTAIFSRGIRKSSNEQILDSNIGSNELLNKMRKLEQSKQPDLIIADYNSIFIPSISTQIESPFFTENSELFYTIAENIAYGLGLSMMFYAFDNIRLGSIQWPKVISDGFNLQLIE